MAKATAQSRLDRVEFAISTIVCAVVAAGVVIGLVANSVFQGWIREDGPLEWATFAGLVLCSLLCWRRAVVPRAQSSVPFRVFAVFCGLAFLFGAGEEISWGQRLLGLQTPDWFTRNNSQSEINVHNLEVFGLDLTKWLFGKLLVVGLATYLLVLPYIYRISRRFGGFADNWGLPITRPRQALLFLAVAAAIHLPDIPGRESELFEFAAVFLVYLVFVNPLNQHVFRPVAV